MSVLFGHPTGNPPAYNAGLAYYRAGLLESICIPWMPSQATLRLIDRLDIPQLSRLRRRHFAPLVDAPKTQGRLGEFCRLAARAAGYDSDKLAARANEWLMHTMADKMDSARVRAVHAYEDCSLQQFRRAKRLGKACIYGMPTGYFRAWERMRAELDAKYADWVPAQRSDTCFTPEEQKHEEMELADIVLAASNFTADSIREYYPDKQIVLAPYGVDPQHWPFIERRVPEGTMTFLYAGQCSILKGTPLLLRAWQAAGLRDARLCLVGGWRLAEQRKAELPLGCTWLGPVSREKLRTLYQQADVFVFPTNFEGFGMVVAEALSCGLPVVTTKGRGGDGLVDDASGRTIPADDLDAMVETLRWFGANRDQIPRLSRGAGAGAARHSWDNYRSRVTAAAQRVL